MKRIKIKKQSKINHLVTNLDIDSHFKVIDLMPYLKCNIEAEINTVEFLSIKKRGCSSV